MLNIPLHTAWVGKGVKIIYYCTQRSLECSVFPIQSSDVCAKKNEANKSLAKLDVSHIVNKSMCETKLEYSVFPIQSSDVCAKNEANKSRCSLLR